MAGKKRQSGSGANSFAVLEDGYEPPSPPSDASAKAQQVKLQEKDCERLLELASYITHPMDRRLTRERERLVELCLSAGTLKERHKLLRTVIHLLVRKLAAMPARDFRNRDACANPLRKPRLTDNDFAPLFAAMGAQNRDDSMIADEINKLLGKCRTEDERQKSSGFHTHAFNRLVTELVFAHILQRNAGVRKFCDSMTQTKRDFQDIKPGLSRLIGKRGNNIDALRELVYKLAFGLINAFSGEILEDAKFPDDVLRGVYDRAYGLDEDGLKEAKRELFEVCGHRARALRSVITQLIDELFAAYTDIRQMESDTKEDKHCIEELQKYLDDATNQASDAKQDAKNKQARILELEKERDASERSQADQASRIKNLEKALAASEQRLASLTIKSDAKTAEIDALKQALADKQEPTPVEKDSLCDVKPAEEVSGEADGIKVLEKTDTNKTLVDEDSCQSGHSSTTVCSPLLPKSQSGDGIKGADDGSWKNTFQQLAEWWSGQPTATAPALPAPDSLMPAWFW